MASRLILKDIRGTVTERLYFQVYDINIYISHYNNKKNAWFTVFDGSYYIWIWSFITSDIAELLWNIQKNELHIAGLHYRARRLEILCIFSDGLGLSNTKILISPRLAICWSDDDKCLWGHTQLQLLGDLHHQGIYSLRGKTSYDEIVWRLEAVRLGASIIESLWNVLPKLQWTFRAVQQRGFNISKLQGIAKSGDKSSFSK